VRADIYAFTWGKSGHHENSPEANCFEYEDNS